MTSPSEIHSSTLFARVLRRLSVPTCALFGSFLGALIGVVIVLVPLSSPTPTDASIVVHSGSASLFSRSLAVGTLVVTYDATPPSDNWLLCDGRLVDPVEYPALHTSLRSAAIGAQVRLPDYRGMRFGSSPSASGWLEGTIAPATDDFEFVVSFWVRGR